MTVRAIYEQGVFRPLGPVDLPENSTVEFEPSVVGDGTSDEEVQKRIYQLLGQSFPSGETDVAERHNEHQP